MSFADEASELAHSSSDAVKAFTAVLYPACVQDPVFDRWVEVT
jgi:hypothetical protein